MSKSRTLIEQICYSLGKNNDASYAVVAVATAKGIFRPMFTMMDKHQDHETKKYTALREKRSYKNPFSKYEALEILAKEVNDGNISQEVYNALVKAV